ncbi:hypothetical protein [Thauera sp.]
MTTKEKGAVPFESAPTSETTSAHSTKKATIRFALSDPHGLNRFEAERLGDHCLNTTVAVLRAEGCVIHSEWERVPTRFNPRGVRVLRYWLTGRVWGG